MKKEQIDADLNGNDPNTIWDNPLFLPAGSIRSIIALLLVVFSCWFMYEYRELPDNLNTLVMVVLGWYFSKQ